MQRTGPGEDGAPPLIWVFDGRLLRSGGKTMRMIATLTLVLVASVGSLGVAQSVRAQSRRSQVEEELRRLNAAVSEMQVRKDVAAATRLLADDYVFLQADGQVSNKAQNIAGLGDPAFVCESLTTDGVEVRVFGDVGVITGRAHFRAKFKGQEVDDELLYTDVWVKRQGRWQNVVSQATRRPRPQ